MEFPNTYGIKNIIRSWSEDPEDDKKYNVFHRTWWRRKSSGDLEPSPGKKHYIKKGVSFSEARDIAQVWNKNHDPGPLSDKAEFEEA